MVIPHWEEYLCEVLEANFTSCTNRIAQFGFNLDLNSREKWVEINNLVARRY